MTSEDIKHQLIITLTFFVFFFALARETTPKRIALKGHVLKELEMYSFQVRPCISQPGNFTGWDSEGVKAPPTDKSPTKMARSSRCVWKNKRTMGTDKGQKGNPSHAQQMYIWLAKQAVKSVCVCVSVPLISKHRRWKLMEPILTRKDGSGNPQFLCEWTKRVEGKRRVIYGQ